MVLWHESDVGMNRKSKLIHMTLASAANIAGALALLVTND
jgi:hypothetical protein